MNTLGARTDEPELLDGDTISFGERMRALGQLPKVNRYFGGTRAVLRELAPLRERWGGDRVVRLLDIGCGAGDIPLAIIHWGRRQGLDVRATGVDMDPASLTLARRRGAGEHRFQLVRGSGLRLPMTDNAVDVAIASMVLHHFYGSALLDFVGEMTRVARHAVIVNDLHRHPLALLGWRTASPLFFRGHVVRHDGAVSVRRGFVPVELQEIAGRYPKFRWKVRSRFAFRLVLCGLRVV